MKFEELFVGQEKSIKRVFSKTDVKKFADLSGDFNPIHLDVEFSKKTIFERPIVHGFLYSSLISSIIANHLPGPGSIYINQELNFKKPVFHDDELMAVVRVLELKPISRIIVLETNCFVNHKIQVLAGKAVIKLLENE
jgi:acyl dehydratase